MRITVTYNAQLKAALGKPNDVVDFPADARVADVVAWVVDKYPEEAGQFFVDGHGRLLPSILVCVDDDQRPADDPQTLSDGVTVTFLSFSAFFTASCTKIL